MTLGSHWHHWPPDVTLRQRWGRILDLFMVEHDLRKQG